MSAGWQANIVAAITDGGGGSERWSLHVRYSRQEVHRWRRRLVMWNTGGDRPHRRVVSLGISIHLFGLNNL